MPPTSPESLNKLYKLYGEAQTAYADYTALLENDPDKADIFARNNEELLEMRAHLRDSVGVLSGIRKEMTALYANKELTGQQKRALLNAMKIYRMDYARERLQELRPVAIDDEEGGSP